LIVDGKLSRLRDAGGKLSGLCVDGANSGLSDVEGALSRLGDVGGQFSGVGGVL
jgi:hypothetical protein